MNRREFEVRAPSASPSRKPRLNSRDDGSPSASCAPNRILGELLLLLHSRLETHLSRQDVLVVLQNEVDAFTDVDRNGHLRPVVQELQALCLLGRDVNGRRDFLSRHVTPGPTR